MADYYTPGPWASIYNYDGSGYRVVKFVSDAERTDSVRVVKIALVSPPLMEDIDGRSPAVTMGYNADLLAAAPELLDALRGLLAVIETDELMPESISCMVIAKQAIRKAFGGHEPQRPFDGKRWESLTDPEKDAEIERAGL